MLRTIIFIFSLLPLFASSQEVNRQSKFYKAYYYENGSISSEGQLIDGKPDGYWITYYPNELRKSEGNRKDFQLDGEWKFYDEKGNLKDIISYKEGIKDGFSKKFKDCFLSGESEFQNGIQVGIEREFFPDSSNSKIKQETPYDTGRRDGIGYVYAIDGRILEIITYEKGFISKREKINRKDEEGLKQGIWKEFYANGKLKSESRYKNGELNGYVKNYTPDGKLEEAELFLDDVKQSEEENQADFEIRYTYYDDGNIKSATTYNLAGMKDGVAQFFQRSGAVDSSKVYENGFLIAKGIINRKGVKVGSWETYFLDGKLKSKGDYKSGKKYGKWIYYFNSGQKEQEGFYDNSGLFTGEWRWYYENGNLLRTEEFLRGEEDGMLTEYDINSQIITEGEYLEGEKEGEWYYSLNDHSENGKYLYGERNGYWEFKHPNGKTAFEGVFEGGRPQGKHKYYNQSGVLIREEEYNYGVRDGKWRWYDDDGIEYLIIIYKDGLERKVNGAKFKIESE